MKLHFQVLFIFSFVLSCSQPQKEDLEVINDQNNSNYITPNDVYLALGGPTNSFIIDFAEIPYYQFEGKYTSFRLTIANGPSGNLAENFHFSYKKGYKLPEEFEIDEKGRLVKTYFKSGELRQTFNYNEKNQLVSILEKNYSQNYYKGPYAQETYFEWSENGDTSKMTQITLGEPTKERKTIFNSDSKIKSTHTLYYVHNDNGATVNYEYNEKNDLIKADLMNFEYLYNDQGDWSQMTAKIEGFESYSWKIVRTME